MFFLQYEIADGFLKCICKAHPTLITCVASLRVDYHVSLKVSFSCKSTMNSHVKFKRSSVCKTLPTLITCIWLLFIMTSHVNYRLFLYGKHFPHWGQGKFSLFFSSVKNYFEPVSDSKICLQFWHVFLPLHSVHHSPRSLPSGLKWKQKRQNFQFKMQKLQSQKCEGKGHKSETLM